MEMEEAIQQVGIHLCLVSQELITCDGASGQYAEFYCEKGERPNMCDW